MSSPDSTQPPSASRLKIEARRLVALLDRFLTHSLNRLLELSASGASRRRLRFLMAVLVIGVIAFGAHILLQFRFRAEAEEFRDLAGLLPVALVTGLRIILVVGIATSAALHISGRFLADIFELKDARAAWRYIDRLAAGSGEEVLHLQEGRIADADKESPILQIGGPGRVMVDFDTAALFEQSDGTPHVIGSVNGSENAGGGLTTGFLLEGFERLREPIISLRDQYIGNPSGEPITVIGRSLDAMPISVTDVRGVFSIRRQVPPEKSAARAEQPYAFRARDIESLIYNQPVAVLTSGEFPSGLPGDWTAAMHVLIRDSLRDFMSQYRLAEYLAGVGAHEAERSEYRADTILTKALQISSEVPSSLSARSTDTPKLRSRTELSSKFKKYGSEFSTRAQELGLELHWIGVGTWKIPDEASEAMVSGKNVEAWRLSRENALRSDPGALESVTQSALGEHKLRLVQEVPIARHHKNRARYTDKLVLMECLLQDFWEQLGEALDIHYRNDAPSTDVQELESAVLKVEQLLHLSQIGHVIGDGTTSRVRKRAHWHVSKDGPPAPESRAEAAQYQMLLGKLKGDYRVAEAMIANERRRHGDLTREQLIARIVERFERHGR